MTLIKISSTEVNENTITPSHFGGNYLFNREFFNEGVGDSGGYDEVAEDLNVTHLRYPGGGMAERQFSLSDPENTFQDTDLTTGEVISNTKKYDLTPMNEFLEYAQDINAQVSIVLPSKQYHLAIIEGDENTQQEAKEEIQNFVHNVLSGNYGGTVEAFELGNEYYGAGDMSSSQYGYVADKMAIWVQEAIDSSGSGFDPMIAVQSGQRLWTDNYAIMNQFSPEGLSAIDAVIAHTYQKTPWEKSNIDSKAAFVDEWNSRKGEGADLKWMVSEWDVTQNADDGLGQGAAILEMFNQLVLNGMDIGHIWPLLENTETELAGNVTLGTPTNLMISGEVFRQMSESLVGLQAIDMNSSLNIDADSDIDALTHIYTNSDGNKLVVFLSSLDANVLDIDLDLSGFGNISTNYDHLWATQVSELDGQDPLSANSSPKVTTLTSADVEGTFSNDGIVSVSLSPHNIIRFEFTVGEGVSLNAHDQSSQNDVLLGSKYADTLVGYAGNDILKGGSGNDQLDGGTGKNVLHGHGGDDILEGGSERDRLLGGGGNDHLYGNDGNDVLRGGAGDDMLEGAAGADTFIFRDDWNHDTIVDFQDDLDRIVLHGLGIENTDDLSLYATQVENDVVFNFDADNSLTIQNTYIEEIYDDVFYL